MTCTVKQMFLKISVVLLVQLFLYLPKTTVYTEPFSEGDFFGQDTFIFYAGKGWTKKSY